MRYFYLIFLVFILSCTNKMVLGVKSCNVDLKTVENQIPALKTKDLGLYLLIKDKDIGSLELTNLLSKAKEYNVKITLWPLLDENKGPWPNENNSAEVTALIEKLMTWIDMGDFKIDAISINMENSLQQMEVIRIYLNSGNFEAITTILLNNLNKGNFESSVKQYQNLVNLIHNKGYKVYISTYPFILDDMLDKDADIQDLVNVPVSGINWDAYIFNTYRTAYSNDLKINLTSYMVYNYGLTAKLLLGDRARLSMGIIGDSEHGRGFKDIEDLNKDLSAAKAAGIKYIELFSLKGILDNGGLNSWVTKEDIKFSIPQEDRKILTIRALTIAADSMLNSGANKNLIDLIKELNLIK